MEHDKPEDFLISQWQSSHKSFYYVIYRWIIATFCIFSVTVSVLEDINDGTFSTIFIYFTYQSLFMSMITTLMSAVLSTLYYMGAMQVNGKMTTLLKIFWILSSITVAFSCLVTSVYWSAIHEPEKYPITLGNILVHGTNSIFLVMDLFIVKHPARFSMGVYPVGTGLLYLFFTWLYPYLGGVNK